MIFFDTSNYKVNPENDSMNYRSKLVRRFTEDDDNEFDKMPKSEENPVVSIETINEKPKPKEDSAVMDEDLKPLDSPVHFRELLLGPPSGQLEGDDKLEEKSNPVVYLMCCRKHLPQYTPDHHEYDHECEDKSKPKLDLVYRTSCEALCPEVTTSYTKRKKRFSKVHCSEKTIDDKLAIEMVAKKPKPQKDSMYAEEPLQRTSPNDDDESVPKAPAVEEVTETAKPTVIFVEQTGMLLITAVSETEASTVLPIEDTEMSARDRNCGLGGKSMLDEVEFDKKPKSGENPLAFMETVSEKQKPKEDSTVVIFEMKDETVMPPNDRAYSREGLTGPPFSCRECDDEFAETLKPEVYLLCYGEQLSNLLSDCLMLNNLSEAFCSKKSFEEKLVIETVTEKPKPQKDSMYAEEPLPRTSSNGYNESVLEAPTI
jgi:hypothetical protein